LFERSRDDGASGWPEKLKPPRDYTRTAALDKSRARGWIVSVV
jgi:hypothetical protein